MDQGFKDDLLKSAIEIGREIIDQAIIDSSGLHWRTVKEITPYNDVYNAVSETIYSGVSGIVLFYIELYKETKDVTYLEIIHNCGGWLIENCRKELPSHGFYAGRLGTVYTLLKIGEIDKSDFYREKALNIAIQFKDLTKVPINQFNLFDGLGGTILGLLHLHSETREEWILNTIEKGLQILLKGSKSNGTGLYWDLAYRNSTSISIKPLCSLPLGPSGIGFLFLQISQYFNNPAYEFIAEQSFLYDDQYFDSEKQNWPNFQINTKAIDSKRLRKAYQRGNYHLFKKHKKSTNWMNGLTGIVFARLFAFNTGNNSYATNLNTIIEILDRNLLNTNLFNNTLATGKAGLGLFLLQVAKIKPYGRYTEVAFKIAKESIQEKRNKKYYQFGFDRGIEYEDNSLFMGNAGVGYFYLRLLSSKKTDHILLPQLAVNAISNTNHSLNYLKKEDFLNLIIHSWFPYTLEIIKKNNLFESIKLDFKAIKKSLLQEIDQIVSSANNQYLTDAYNYEYCKDTSVKLIAANYCLFLFTNQVEFKINRNILEKRSDQELMKETLSINPYAELIESKWNWARNTNLVHDPCPLQEDTLILYFDFKQMVLSDIQYVVLQCFAKPAKVMAVYKQFIEANEVEKEDLNQVEALFLETIKNFIKSGVLICSRQISFYDKWLNRNSRNIISDLL